LVVAATVVDSEDVVDSVAAVDVIRET